MEDAKASGRCLWKNVETDQNYLLKLNLLNTRKNIGSNIPYLLDQTPLSFSSRL